MSVQPFPPLDSATEAALRASIERFGVLVPVVRDQNGRILDGHHRSRIAKSLGVSFEAVVQVVADEDEAREIARTLNEDRRQMTREQRREVAAALREDGHSQRAIAKALGVSQPLINKDLQAPDNPVITSSARVVGLDGKTYPARKKSSNGGPGKGRDRTKPLVVNNTWSRNLSNRQRDRVVHALTQINGLCRGLKEIDIRAAVAAMTPDEVCEWSTYTGSLARELRQFKSTLMEVGNGS